MSLTYVYKLSVGHVERTKKGKVKPVKFVTWAIYSTQEKAEKVQTDMKHYHPDWVFDIQRELIDPPF